MPGLDVPQEVVLPAICVLITGFLAALDSADVDIPLPLPMDLLFVPLQVFGSGKALRASGADLGLCVILEVVSELPLLGEVLVAKWARKLTAGVRRSSRARTSCLVRKALARGSSIQVRI